MVTCEKCGAKFSSEYDFCPKCGTSYKEYFIRKVNRGRRRNIFIIIGVYIISVAISVVLSWHFSPAGETVHYLLSGNGNTAIECSKRATGSLIQEKIIQYYGQQYIAQEIDNYKHDQISVNELSEELAIVSEFPMEKVVNPGLRIANSVATFQDAQNLKDSGDYFQAISEYNMVIEEDPNYETAIREINTCAEFLREQITSLHPENEEEYISAIENAEEALSLDELHNDSVLKEFLERIQEEYENLLLIAETESIENITEPEGKETQGMDTDAILEDVIEEEEKETEVNDTPEERPSSSSKQELEQNYAGLSYDTVISDPDNYFGSNITLSGSVVSVSDQSKAEITMTIQLNLADYTTVKCNYYKNEILQYDISGEVSDKYYHIQKDDTVTVYGVFTGLTEDWWGSSSNFTVNVSAMSINNAKEHWINNITEENIPPELQDYYSGITYDQLIRYPEEFYGCKVVFSGNVSYVSDQGNDRISLSLRLNSSDYITIDCNYYFSQITEYSSNWEILEPKRRLLEDDTIAVYGTFSEMSGSGGGDGKIAINISAIKIFSEQMTNISSYNSSDVITGYEDYVNTISYDELLRTPDQYRGHKQIYTGTVNYISDQNKDSVTFSLRIDSSSYVSIDCEMYLSNVVQYSAQNELIEDNKWLVEGDFIMVYSTFNGISSGSFGSETVEIHVDCINFLDMVSIYSESISDDSIEELKDYNTGIAYDQLIRDPEMYYGDKIIFKGTIFYVSNYYRSFSVKLPFDNTYIDVDYTLDIATYDMNGQPTENVEITDDKEVVLFGRFTGINRDSWDGGNVSITLDAIKII